MSGAPLPALADEELERLEAMVVDALRRGQEGDLPVLGYGEISLVLGWPPEHPALACKRLPPFPSRERFDAYQGTLLGYIKRLSGAGVHVVPTEMRGVDLADGRVAAYLLQPLLPTAQLAPEVLRRSDPEAGHPLVDALVEAAERTIGPLLGLDAQLSNWAWDGARLTYLDVSTPLAWDASGRTQLDLDLLAQAYPAALRPALRRYVAPRILDSYRDLRAVYLDLAGNLLKERLEPWIGVFLEAIGDRVDPPIDPGEVHRYYRSDARLWEALLLIRRLDRAWRRRIRRRPYPFLLPGRIER